jgi:DNA topoisomerase-1
MASLTRKQSPDDLTLDEAVALLAAKAAAGPAKKGGRFAKKSAAKPAAKPAPKRKSATA